MNANVHSNEKESAILGLTRLSMSVFNIGIFSGFNLIPCEKN